jgi:hypothetical protein
LAVPLAAQEPAVTADATGKIIIDTRGERPKPAFFHTVVVDGTATLQRERVVTEATVEVTRYQGEGNRYAIGLRGADEVVSVTGDSVASWAVRREGDGSRVLEVAVKTPEVDVHRFTVKLESAKFATFPTSVELTHFALAGRESVSFRSTLALAFAAGVTGRVTMAEGFAPLADPEGTPRSFRYQTTTGGKLAVQLNRSGLAPEPVEFDSLALRGSVDFDGKTADFSLSGTVKVSEPGASVTILAGNAALTNAPQGEAGRIVLAQENGAPVLRLVFPDAGEFPIDLDFVAAVTEDGPWRRLDFTVGSSAVMPLCLSGLAEETEFTNAGGELLPEHDSGNWLGFLPAGGRARLAWKPGRPAGEGKLFFTTSALVETTLGAGLLRQDHRIDYRVLQGEIESLVLDLAGAGEVVSVEGAELTSWKVVDGEGGERRLEVSLGRPIEGAASLSVRTQTPLDAFPVKTEAVRLTPRGAVRHAGYLRLSNLGSVRLEPSVTTGLAQLSPEQYPGNPLEARQVFVYRFPSADYELGIGADRVQPEVGVSQLVVYEVTETERRLSADLELDIREAPIREWVVEFPGDYSLVSATGSTLADFLVAGEVVNGRKKLTLLFGAEVTGRQLVNLVLEKSEAATAASWVLPRLEFPEAKSVRGDIGVAGAHGFRVSTESADLLVEKPLSYFPKPTPRLQQAFRIREPGWAATMKVEPLQKSVSADVFHLYALSEGAARASVVINYFVTGAPVSEWEVAVPADVANPGVEGQNVRTWRREGDKLIVSLHQPVIGPSTLLVTFEESIPNTGGTLAAGRVAPLGVADERGYIEIVSPGQVKLALGKISPELLALDPLELPAEFRLLAAAPSQGVWQYTARPFELNFNVGWFEPGTTVPQAVEFAEAVSRVSKDGEAVTDLVYFVKSRARSALDLKLPAETRLWSVTVAGATVNARQDGGITRIPLPGSVDPDIPIEVRLRLGRSGKDLGAFNLALPQVDATVLKTEWALVGEEKEVLYPVGGTVAPPQPVRVATGFAGIARNALGLLAGIVVLAVVGVGLTRSSNGLRRFAGWLALLLATALSLWAALVAVPQGGSVAPLRISLPLAPANDLVELSVRSVPSWQANLSWPGIVLMVGGLVAILVGRKREETKIILAGAAALLAGLLWQRGSEEWFFGLLAVLIAFGWLWPRTRDAWKDRPRKTKPVAGGEGSTAAAAILVGTLLVLTNTPIDAQQAASGYSTAKALVQKAELRHGEAKLRVTATVSVAGKAGDSFVLLRSPAVLTAFKGTGLNLSREAIDGGEAGYVITIAAAAAPTAPVVPAVPFVSAPAAADELTATFSYELPMPDPAAGVTLPTGVAAFATIEARHNRAGWEFQSDRAVRARPLDGTGANESATGILIASGAVPTLTLKPKARDIASEKTIFYVEGDQLFLPGPGVLDGKHRFRIRPAQGRVASLVLNVPTGLTVSEVTGPVGSWQFDAEAGSLSVAVEPPQTAPFEVLVMTQRGLAALPTDLELAPVRVSGAAGEVGLAALAFGPDAQPENAAATGMSEVNPGDFDASLLPEQRILLHRVYRYGAEKGAFTARINAVAPEVRVTSRQVLSFGEERIVLSVELGVEITRAGLFQLGFGLPDGFEVESLSGSALRDWAETGEDGAREVVLHLNGRTLGAQTFSMTLAATTPTGEENWKVANITLKEASRQSGELVVRPAEGIRLRTAERTNLSEVDPRELGGDARDALAYRLLQKDWTLTLGVEKLDPWITGQVLHAVTLREGQTRTALTALLKIENAAIRDLRVRIPGLGEEEAKTLRASGPAVGDLVRVAPDSDEWDIRFQRRLIGEARVSIEYERRGEREGGKESLVPVTFPNVRQPSYFFAVRSAGRLELSTTTLPGGWQATEWSAVPAPLREAAGDRSSPAITLRAATPQEPAVIEAKRHSLAEALKLRVAGGRVTTLLSPAGDELTSVDLTIEVVQRGSLTVGLPKGGELFHLFVNGESVHFVREGDAWQFFILPGTDDRTAEVRFAYVVPASVSGAKPGRVDLASPSLGVPMENLVWDVILPPGMEMTHDEGDLEPREIEPRGLFDRNRYLAESQARREDQNRRATALLDQANALIQSGDNSGASKALSSVANGFAIDEASNEDARVQLENLRTQQAVVGLNTRRQRLVLDHETGGGESVVNEQVKQGAAFNRVLNEGDLNYRPDELPQLLQGNTSDDNASLQRIAGKIVRQQQGTESIARPMGLVLPTEGMVYRFERPLQVAENAPLNLELGYAPQARLAWWRVFVGVVLLAVAALLFAGRIGRFSE